MKIALDYGATGLTVDLPDDCLVVRPQESRAVEDPGAALLAALRNPVEGAALAQLEA